MIESPPVAASSLRERKKQHTRRMLIDAAVDLCLRRGYDGTTVEQIAEAADVSTRTFNRYFATKDAVFIAVLDDLADEVVAELRAQPPDLGPMEALRAAHVAVLSRLTKHPVAGLSAERLALILRIVYASDALRQAAIDYRSGPAMEILAEHMGVPVDDSRLELGVALFATTIVNACGDLVRGDPGVKIGPEAVLERLDGMLVEVARFAAELDVG